MTGKDDKGGKAESLDAIILDCAHVLLPDLASEDAALNASAVAKQERIIAALAGFNTKFYETVDSLFDGVRQDRASAESFLVVADLTRQGRNDSVVVHEHTWRAYRFMKREFPDQAYLEFVGDVEAITNERIRKTVSNAAESDDHLVIAGDYADLKQVLLDKAKVCVSFGDRSSSVKGAGEGDEDTQVVAAGSSGADPDEEGTTEFEVPGALAEPAGKYVMRALVCGFADDSENFGDEIGVLLKGIDGCQVFYTDVDLGILVNRPGFADYFTSAAFEHDGYDRIIAGVNVRDEDGTVKEMLNLASVVGLLQMTVSADRGELGIVYDSDAYRGDVAKLEEKGLLKHVETYPAEGESDDARAVHLKEQARHAMRKLIHDEAMLRAEEAKRTGVKLAPSEVRVFGTSPDLYEKADAGDDTKGVVDLEEEEPAEVRRLPPRPPRPSPPSTPPSPPAEDIFETALRESRRKTIMLEQLVLEMSGEFGVTQQQREFYCALGLRFSEANEKELRTAVLSVIREFSITTTQQDRYFDVIKEFGNYSTELPPLENVTTFLMAYLPQLIQEEGERYDQIHDLIRVAVMKYTKGGAGLLHEGVVVWKGFEGKPYQEWVAKLMTNLTDCDISSAPQKTLSIARKADDLDEEHKVAYFKEIFRECSLNTSWDSWEEIDSVSDSVHSKYLALKKARPGEGSQPEKPQAEAGPAPGDKLQSVFDSPPNTVFTAPPAEEEAAPGSQSAAEAQPIHDHAPRGEGEEGKDDDAPKAEEPVDDLGGKDMVEDENKGTGAPGEAPATTATTAAPALEERVGGAEPAGAAPATPAATQQDYDLTTPKTVAGTGAAAAPKPGRSGLYRNLFFGGLAVTACLVGGYFGWDYLRSHGPGRSLEEIEDSRAAAARSANSMVPVSAADALQKMYCVQSYRTSESEADLEGYSRHMDLANEAVDLGLGFDPEMPVSELEAELVKTRRLYERFAEKMRKEMGTRACENPSPLLPIPSLFGGPLDLFRGYALAPEAGEPEPAVEENAPVVSAPEPAPASDPAPASTSELPAPGNYVPHHRSHASSAALGHKMRNPHVTPAYLLGPGSHGHGHR